MSSGGVLQRASAYANLSPAERAILSFLRTLLTGGLVAGAQAVYPLLNGGDFARVNWGAALHTFLVAFVLAVVLSVGKYHRSFKDPALVVAPSPPAASTSPLAIPLVVSDGAQGPASASSLSVSLSSALSATADQAG